MSSALGISMDFLFERRRGSAGQRRARRPTEARGAARVLWTRGPWLGRWRCPGGPLERGYKAADSTNARVPAKPIQIKTKQKSLDLLGFGGIGTFQWVTGEKIKKCNSQPSPEFEAETAVWDDLSPRRLRFVRVAIHLCSAVVAFFERKKGTAWELQKIYFPPRLASGVVREPHSPPSRAPGAEGSLVRP